MENLLYGPLANFLKTSHFLQLSSLVHKTYSSWTAWVYLLIQLSVNKAPVKKLVILYTAYTKVLLDI